MLDSVMNWLAASGIFLCVMRYRDSHSAVRQIRQQYKQLKQAQQYVLSPDSKLNKADFLNNKHQQNLILQVHPSKIKNLLPNTFTRTYHDFNITTHESIHFNPFHNNFMEGQTGGQFYLKAKDQTIKVDIRQCNIHHNLLLKNDPQKLKIIQNKDPIYQSITYKMRTGVSLLAAGVLSYNFEQKQWLFLPSFLMNKNHQNSIGQNMNQAFQFLQRKASVHQVGKAVSICIIFFMLGIRYKQINNFLKSIYHKITQFFRKKHQFDFEAIKEVIAKESDRLCCPCGKTLNVVYPCRHLSSCEACYEAARVKVCRLCGADGERVIKIFT